MTKDFQEGLTRAGDIRIEQLTSLSKGYILQTAGEFSPIQRSRFIPLAGVGAEYTLKRSTFYANCSQAYRPVTYSDLTPAGTTDVIDTKLKDASGFNVDAGWRGTAGRFFNVDMSIFYLSYNNRIGTVQREGTNFKTNIGASVSKGVELFAETFPRKVMRGYLSGFISACTMDARYTRWDNPQIADSPETSIVDKHVEYAPRHIFRGGLNISHKRFNLYFQSNFVDEVFTNAENTILPNSTATIGILEAYLVHDLGLGVKISDNYSLKAGINNLTNTIYATRRSGG